MQTRMFCFLSGHSDEGFYFHRNCMTMLHEFA